LVELEFTNPISAREVEKVRGLFLTIAVATTVTASVAIAVAIAITVATLYKYDLGI
jgi:hypothetical protein